MPVNGASLMSAPVVIGCCSAMDRPPVSMSTRRLCRRLAGEPRTASSADAHRRRIPQPTGKSVHSPSANPTGRPSLCTSLWTSSGVAWRQRKDTVARTSSPASSEASRSASASITQSWSPAGSARVWTTRHSRVFVRLGVLVVHAGRDAGLAGDPQQLGAAGVAVGEHRVVLGVVGLDRLVPRRPGHHHARGGSVRSAAARSSAISPSRSSRATRSTRRHIALRTITRNARSCLEIGRGGVGGSCSVTKRADVLGVVERLPLVEQRGVGLPDRLPQPLHQVLELWASGASRARSAAACGRRRSGSAAPGPRSGRAGSGDTTSVNDIPCSYISRTTDFGSRASSRSHGCCCGRSRRSPPAARPAAAAR